MNELLGILRDARKHLMKGVSHMIPFVVAGGVLFAAAVIINGEGAVPDTGFAADLWALGAAAMGFMVPILAGFIAFPLPTVLVWPPAWPPVSSQTASERDF